MAIFLGKKKRMMEKLLTVRKQYSKEGYHSTILKGFILNYSNKCNFQCQHCYTKSGAGEFGETILTIEDVKSLADQADELGVYEIDIQGGEPLLNPHLFDILEAIDTDRFYTYITTNGWLMTKEMAERLAAAGLDRVSVSVDAFSAEEHDQFRKKKGSFERCMNALKIVQEAGMQAYVNIVVGHYNAQSQELRNFVDYISKNGYGIAFNCASPTGNWRGNYDAMLTPDDTAAIRKLKEDYPEIIRDLWNYLNPDQELLLGCPAVNLFYVNPSGDILPCPYIQAKLGNIKEDPLKDIIKRGFMVPEFREYSDKCLSGENVEFAKKYLDKDTSVLNPISVDEMFNDVDFTKGDIK